MGVLWALWAVYGCSYNAIGAGTIRARSRVVGAAFGGQWLHNFARIISKVMQMWLSLHAVASNVHP